jgi:N-methylhydantoinase A/oxoprolinase/acetone carboxylase beta subunit
MLTAEVTTDEILHVLPGQRVGYDPLARGIYAYREEDNNGLAIWDRPLPESESAHSQKRHGLGLGIDAGGTYTDAVIYDYETDRVLAKGKSPTTKWDYTLGIDQALQTLPPDLLKKVNLTVVSTTLATNAIVEGQGQKVGLILMPLGKETGEQLSQPWAVIQGNLNIQGDELTPLDKDEVIQTVRDMVKNHGVGAFAVSGYGGTANSAHEEAVKEIIRKETGLGVCCGHELSSSLNFYVRANTAVLNASIIPLLEAFIANLEEALAGRKVGGRVMIVRGDGSLMSREMAKSHPVETALSGPAASVTGARYMVQKPGQPSDLLVIDVGGTTSDIGIVESGEIRLTEEGAHVGSWRTHVKAVDMNTLGTGGDSRILIERRNLTVGPRRIAPISRLSQLKGWEETIAFMARLHDNFFSSTAAMEVLAVTGREPDFTLSRDEQRLYNVLKERPHTIKELALTQGHGLWHILDTVNMEKKAIVQRYGLTPTDILTARGEIDLWDRDLAERVLGFYEVIWDREPGQLGKDVFTRAHKNIMETLLLKELDLGDNRKNLSAKDPVFQLLMKRLDGDSLSLNLIPRIKHPLVGVGAAAPFLLKETAEKLGTELIIPQDGDVANAVGAVCSLVTVKRTGEIQPGPEGSFLVLGGAAPETFDDFDRACHWLEEEITHLLREDALMAGTEETSISWSAHNRISETAEGITVFLGRNYTARITGLPA